MQAYRTYLTITDPSQVIIANVPFQVGEVVEVLLLVQDTERKQALRRLESLLQQTQSLPQVQQLSDEVIAHEIAAYRSGQ
jgi:hypothetical protein